VLNFSQTSALSTNANAVDVCAWCTLFVCTVLYVNCTFQYENTYITRCFICSLNWKRNILTCEQHIENSSRDSLLHSSFSSLRLHNIRTKTFLSLGRTIVLLFSCAH
jgi:hypothetical protein